MRQRLSLVAALALLGVLAAACGGSSSVADASPADVRPDAEAPTDAPPGDGPPAACGDAGVCLPGTVCCGAPLACAGRCVPDCRLGDSCPTAAPTCNPQTGVCEPSGTPDVSSQQFTVLNPTSVNDWWAKAFFPDDASAANPYPAVVTVPGGSGAGSDAENAVDPSKNPAVLAAAGFVVVIFDADGRGHTPGVEDYCGFTHQDGLRALVLAVAALPVVDVDRIGISTGSYGITMGSGVLARYPELPVRFLLDVEGPADRNDTGHCDASNTGHITHDCADDSWWSEREAATFIRQVPVPYLRLQNTNDHAQPDNLHCILMIDHATAVAYGGEGVAPWTRVNLDGMNPPNTVYTAASPPVYRDGSAFDLPALWTEMMAR